MQWVKRGFAKILWWLISHVEWTPFYHLPGYMERWWIRKGESRNWMWGARVHHIMRSDLDRHMHDHPWSYVTIILRGGYYEITPTPMKGLCEVKWYGPGSILIRSYKHTHKLVVPDKTCWTLFIMGRWRQTWGFHTSKGKIPHYEYWAQQRTNKQ